MKKIVFLLICVVLMSGCSVKKVDELSNAEKFAAEFSISEDNPFEYATIDKVLEILDGGTGIIFFGNSDCEWCVESVEILNDALEYKNISEVYYYNPTGIQNKNTAKYKELIKLLDEYLEKDENNVSLLNLPDVYFVKNGKVLGHVNSNITDDLDDESLEKSKIELKDEYLNLISEYVIKECSGEC